MIRAFGLPHFGQTSRWGVGTLTALRGFGRRSGCVSLMVFPLIISGFSALCIPSAHFRQFPAQTFQAQTPKLKTPGRTAQVQVLPSGLGGGRRLLL